MQEMVGRIAWISLLAFVLAVALVRRCFASVCMLRRIGAVIVLSRYLILIWFSLVWYGMVCFDLVWFGLVWFGLVWFGLVWFGLVWFGLVWFGLVW